MPRSSAQWPTASKSMQTIAVSWSRPAPITASWMPAAEAGARVVMSSASRDPAGRGAANVRNGRYPKTVATEIGDVEVLMPRDRQGTFEPVTIPKHARRLDGLAGNVISLYAKGLTTGDIQVSLQPDPEGGFRTTLCRLVFAGTVTGRTPDEALAGLELP